MSKNQLSQNESLRKGDYLVSNNGEWRAILLVSKPDYLIKIQTLFTILSKIKKKVKTI